MTRRRWVVALIVAGCVPVIGARDDGFREELRQGCAGVDACTELRDQAAKRVENCGLVGMNCDIANADLRAAERMLKSAKAEAAERKTERDRLTQAEDARRKAMEEGERQAYLTTAVEDCAKKWKLDPCRGLTNEDDRETCYTRCRDAIPKSKQKVFDDAVLTCTLAIVNSEGKNPSICTFYTPDGPTGSMEGRESECHDLCEARANEALARARLERAEAAKAAARPKPTVVFPTSPPPPPPTMRCGGNARCCDGACSPSCACPGHQGCCSHHGGVCGC